MAKTKFYYEESSVNSIDIFYPSGEKICEIYANNDYNSEQEFANARLVVDSLNFYKKNKNGKEEKKDHSTTR